MEYQLLFRCGLVAAGGALAGAVVAAVLLRLTGRRLRARLEREYGRRRR